MTTETRDVVAVERAAAEAARKAARLAGPIKPWEEVASVLESVAQRWEATVSHRWELVAEWGDESPLLAEAAEHATIAETTAAQWWNAAAAAWSRAAAQWGEAEAEREDWEAWKAREASEAREAVLAAIQPLAEAGRVVRNAAREVVDIAEYLEEGQRNAYEGADAY